MAKFSMTQSQFDAESIRLEAEFKRFAVDMVRGGRIGGKKVYFRDDDGVIRTRKKGIWARVNRIYNQKKERRIFPALPQYADVEDVGRSLDDMRLQIEHLQYRYNQGRDIQTGSHLTGEASKEWKKGIESRRYFIPEKNRERGGHVETPALKALTEIFDFVRRLDDQGIEEFQKMVPQYYEGCEKNYPDGGPKLTKV